jgi:Bcr/CflA subfamily drug resistance transporter
MSNLTQKQKNIVLILCMLSNPVGQIYVDIYLPALPLISQTLKTSEFYSQLSLTIYLLVFAIALPIYGLITDYLGRKKLLILGFLITLIGTVITIFSGSISLFILGRIIQAVGTAASSAIVFPIILDVFTGKELLHAFVYTDAVYAAIPIIAPYIGGVILLFSSWRYIFVFLFLLLLILVIMLSLSLPETKHFTPEKFSFKKLKNDSKVIVTNNDFVCNALIITFSWASIITFNVLGPFLFQKIYGYTPYEYGLAALILGTVCFIAILSNRLLVRHFSPFKLVAVSAIIRIFPATALLIITLIGIYNPIIVLILCCLSVAPGGIVWSNSLTLALKNFTKTSGLATSILFSFFYITWSLTSYIVAKIGYTQIILSSAYLILALSSLSVVIYYIYTQKRNNIDIIS